MKDRKAPRDNAVSETWDTLPWRKLEQHCYRIQKRIYRASQSGKTRAVQKLQKLLLKSEAARLIAVRRATQDNRGKNTAGVDGVKTVPPSRRFTLTRTIHPTNWKRQKPLPVRRVWIPKPGKTEQRPLGIPTMQERCKQALVKMALEPEWEAKFEADSYGFRPGRCCQDAIMAIYFAIGRKPKYVLDADIQGAFDHINQGALLEKLHTYPVLRQAVKAWLEAGVMEAGRYQPTREGTPQGGVISPLLLNIALHGLEQALTEGYPKRASAEKPKLIRYADDLVVLHSRLEDLQKAQATVEHWLEPLGLKLSPKKTRLTHTLHAYQGNVGFDFLGLTIQQFPVGKTHSGKSSQGKLLGYKLRMAPSKEAIQRHIDALGKCVKRFGSVSQETLIRALNPQIWGWSAYYRGVICSRIFSSCDHILWIQLMRWARRRHPHQGIHEIVPCYWRPQNTRKWVFLTPDGVELREHQKMAFRMHIKVKGTASPYDGNLLYWSQRLQRHPLMGSEKARLLQKQQGKCRWCGLAFQHGEVIEIDHITPKSEGGGEELSNKFALHGLCHDVRHAKTVEAAKLRQYADVGINHP